MKKPLRQVCQAVTAAVALLAGGKALPQVPQANPPALQAAVEEAKARLKLSPEQEAQLKPLVLERNQALQAIREKYAGEDSRRARHAMFKEAEPVVENYLARVHTILDEAQYAEWETMRAEVREHLKQQNKKGGIPD